MSKIFFTSDLHFGHKNIIQYDNRPFTDITEMNNIIISNWNKTVNKDDIVYILGDISWYNDQITYNMCSQLNGTKYLIRGNHDKFKSNSIVNNCFKSIKDYDEININNTKIILCHYPIHFYKNQYHGAIMLYGHLHNSCDETYVQDYRYKLDQELNIPCKMYNVGCMMWNYKPVTLEEIIKYD